jgi:type-F conjugative transfer system secretin TraK
MKRINCLFLATLLFSRPVFALQVQTAVEGVPLDFDIAEQELTHIKVENDRIKSVKSATEQLVLEPDEEQGHLFLRPLAKATGSPPSEQPECLQIFIITEQGKTIGLRLHPQDIPAESISIKTDVEIELPQTALTSEDSIVELMQALLNQQALQGYTVSSTLESAAPFLELPTQQTALYLGKSWMGIKFRIENTTRKTLLLNESDFYAPGVRAIAFSHKKLRPKHSATVYIVRER